MTRRRRRVWRCAFLWPAMALAIAAATTVSATNALPLPILLDEEHCPRGWTSAGAAGTCVQLQFEPRRVVEAAGECRKLGAQLVQLRLDEAGDAETILFELSHLINDAIDNGVSELTWMIGQLKKGGVATPRSVKRTRAHSLEPRASGKGGDERETSNEDGTHFALRKKENDADRFEIVELSAQSAHPFICALSALKRKALLYEEALLPNGAPHILDEPPRRTPYHHFAVAWPKAARPNTTASAEDASAGHSYFVRLPCRAIGVPTPRIRWFNTDQNDEIDVSTAQSRYLISGGALYINISESSNAVTSYYCTATNEHGTVRSATAVVRPVFMEPFHASRANVFPLSGGGGNRQINPPRIGGLSGAGTRIECDAPRHYPKSYAFSWVYGSSNEQFISVDERVFVSMDGTLYFSYNVAEDANQYSCILVLPVTQSAQHGPFFRLVLPQFHQLTPPRQQPFAPRIDDLQPSIFPELPLRGETAYIECFAYGFPLPSYKWSRADGLPLPRCHRVTNYGRVLRIDAVELSDAVRYRCTVRNELGVASAEVQLTVRSRPVILRPMSDALVAHNESVVFRCEMHAGSNIGAPRSRTTVEWFHNGRPLAPLLLSRSDRKRVKLSKKGLWIRHAHAHDAGVYQCLVTNDVGSASATALLVVRNVAPRFYANIFPSRVFVAEGTSVQLPCFYQASPRGRSHWRRVTSTNGSMENGSDKLLTLEDDASVAAVLRLDAVDHTDSGLYECTAANADGTAHALVNITILTPAKMRVHVNVGNLNGENSVMDVSCEMEIDCVQEISCPEALFDWKLNDTPIRRLTNSRNGIAQITQSEQILPKDGEALSIRTVDSTELQSIIFNGIPSDDSFSNPTDKLLVMEKPEDSETTTNSHSFFYSPNAGATVSPPIRRLYRSELRLKPDFATRNAGRFACQSAFGVGAVAELAPPPMAGTVATNVRAELLDMHSLPPSNNDDDENIDDGLTLSEFGQYTVSLSWRQPKSTDHNTHDLHVEISGYEIEFRTARSRRWRSAQFVPGSNATILQSTLLRGLEPNQRYQFRVRTKGRSDTSSNSVSAVSPPSEWLTTPKCVPLEGVATIRHTPLDDTHLLIEWDPIELDYSTGDKLRYNVSWRWSDDIISEVVDGASLLLTVPITIVGDCAQLTVGVRPVNEIGEGRYVTDTVILITTIGPRRRAQNARLSPVNSTHLNLTWKWANVDSCESVHGTHISCDEVKAIPIAEDAKTKSRSYRNIYDVMAKSAVSQSVPSHYTHWLVHSLRASTAYRCRLTPFDRHGRWGTSGASTVASTTGPAPPRAPKIIYVRSAWTARRGFSITLEWSAVPLSVVATSATSDNNTNTAAQTANANGHADFESAGDGGYKIFVFAGESAERPTELSLSAEQLFDVARPSARIDGLRRILTYRIQIAGFNKGGMGPMSPSFLVRIDPATVDFYDSSSANCYRYLRSLLTIALLTILLPNSFRDFFSLDFIVN